MRKYYKDKPFERLERSILALKAVREFMVSNVKMDATDIEVNPEYMECLLDIISDELSEAAKAAQIAQHANTAA